MLRGLQFSLAALFVCGALAAETISHPVATSTEDIWRIDQPNVKQPVTDYPNILFIPNDSVIVTAGGCVQTGGSGKTWKLYVNPQGPNSGSFYHGLIQFPASTLPGSLVRIGTIIGQTLVIASNSPGGDLKLGYEDDKYSDNGYWGHDDGTGDQCKGSSDAWVVVDIKHNKAAPPPPMLAEPKFDLVWNNSDDSGFPLNPIWASQINDDTNIPDPNSCLGYPQNFSDPHCSTQSPSIDLPTGWNKFICSFTGTAINGHVNWFPVTYLGQITWSDHSGNDDDYNFDFGSPYGEADVPSNIHKTSLNLPEGSLGLEFDSDETIDHFHTSWWNQFHDAVDSSDTLAQALVLPASPANAVVTGLLGLDCEHTCRTELHPLYNLAMEVFDPSDHTGLGGEVWAIFLRNFGDEGYCSSEDHRLDLSTLSIRIPWKPGATGVTILNKPDNSDNYFRANNNGIVGPNITWAVDQGILVQFEIPSGLSHAMAYGELHLNWSQSSGDKSAKSRVVASSATATRFEEPHEDEGESNVEKLFNALTPPEQRIARTWNKTATFEPDLQSRPRHVPTLVSQLPPKVKQPPKRDKPIPAGLKAANDNSRAKALCKAYEGNSARQSMPCPN